MRDAKGHGSDPRGGAKVAGEWRAAHQTGIGASVPQPADAAAKAARLAKLGLKIYLAQAAAGAAIGGSIPWLRLAGIIP